MNALVAGLAALIWVGAADPAADPAYDPMLSKLDVVTDVAPRKVPLGEEIVWTTTVQHPEGSIGFAMAYTGGTLTVKSSAVRVIGPGKSEARLVLAGLDLGEIALQPLELRYTAADGGDHPFQVLGGKIEIFATTPEEETQRADLAPPVEILRWNYYFFAAAAALLLALAGFIYWRRRPKPLPPPPAPYVDPRTPAQIAFDAIFELQTNGMLERREIKPFTYLLDDIVRRFLIQALGRGELAETTDEFLDSIRSATLDDRMAVIKAFFLQGDRVRFAGEEHEADEARGLCESAIQLVTLLSGNTPKAGTGA